MIRKWIYRCMTVVLLAAILAGCGDGSEESLSEESESVVALEPVTITTEPVNAEPDPVTPDEIKMLCSSDTLDEEKEEKVLDAMKTLHQNLELPEYIGEGIHTVSSEGWLETMTQDLYEGCRSYTIQEGERILLSVQVGFDIGGKVYVNICYRGKEDNLVLLKQAQGVTWLLQTKVSEGKYDGNYEVWQIDSESGKIQREQGTYSGGIMVGECVRSEYAGAPGEAFDLWTNRENFACESTTVTTYDEEGNIVATPTPEPTATPKPTARPAGTPKPAATPRPAATPKPEQPPAVTPAPAQEPDDGPDDSNDGGHEEPPQQPDPPQVPDTPQEPDPPPTTGDTDVEWSPDLM